MRILVWAVDALDEGDGSVRRDPNHAVVDMVTDEMRE